jgi:hypothetical protein
METVNVQKLYRLCCTIRLYHGRHGTSDGPFAVTFCLSTQYDLCRELVVNGDRAGTVEAGDPGAIGVGHCVFEV